MIPQWKLESDAGAPIGSTRRARLAAYRRAMAQLRDRHKTEFLRIYAAELRGIGEPARRHKARTADEEIRDMYGV